MKFQWDNLSFKKATAIQRINGCFGHFLQVCNRKSLLLIYIPLWTTSSLMSGDLFYSLFDLLDLEHCLIHSRWIINICWVSEGRNEWGNRWIRNNKLSLSNFHSLNLCCSVASHQSLWKWNPNLVLSSSSLWHKWERCMLSPYTHACIFVHTDEEHG